MSSWQDAFANFRISVERSWAISHVNLNMHGCDFNRKTLIHRLVLWGMYIYIYVSCLFFENNYIYIHIQLCMQILSKKLHEQKLCRNQSVPVTSGLIEEGFTYSCTLEKHVHGGKPKGATCVSPCQLASFV
jgi:hypothetical protein